MIRPGCRFSPGGILFGLLLSAAVMQAQAPVPHTFGDEHSQRAVTASRDSTTQYHGAVSCDSLQDVPVIEHITPPGDSLLRAENVRHEAMHFVQLAAAGCRKTMALWQHDALAWLLAEAEASCAGLEVYANREKRHSRMQAMILLIGFRRPPGLAFGDVGEAFRAACGEPSELDPSYRP